MKLFWVMTEDHHEDWFIVAPSEEEAEKFHEDNEGYNPGDAWAVEVEDIPDGIVTATSYPEDDLLLSVGAKFIKNDDTRIVEIRGHQYVEGMLEAHIREIDDNIFEALGEERLNQTKRTNPNRH